MKDENYTVEDEKEIEDQFEFILELAQEKYDHENQREQELIQQSGQMQAAFSFMTAALFMALPVIMEHKGELSDNYLLFSISAIVFFLLTSLVLASVAAWRWDFKTQGSIADIKKAVIDSDDWEKYLKRYHRMNSRIKMIEEIQLSKERNNNRRAFLIRASIIAFWCSIGCVIVCYVIAIYLLWK